MAWQQLTLSLGADEMPRIEALLKLSGAQAVAISDDGDDPVLEPAPGSTPVWPRVRLRALFAGDCDVGKVAGLIAGEVTGNADIGIDRLTNEDWAETWRQTITPLALGTRLAIVPAEDLDGPPAPGQLALRMGVAFGTGRHPTTRLCLEWLVEHLRGGESVLDYGCGSGVLALAALRLGAHRAWATDDDPQALSACEENARLNGLADSIRVVPPHRLDCPDAELVLANILTGPLIELAPVFARRQRASGRIVLSGLLPSQAEDVAAAYAPHYKAITIRELEGWCRLTAERAAP